MYDLSSSPCTTVLESGKQAWASLYVTVVTGGAHITAPLDLSASPAKPFQSGIKITLTILILVPGTSVFQSLGLAYGILFGAMKRGIL